MGSAPGTQHDQTGCALRTHTVSMGVLIPWMYYMGWGRRHTTMMLLRLVGVHWSPNWSPNEHRAAGEVAFRLLACSFYSCNAVVSCSFGFLFMNMTAEIG